MVFAYSFGQGTPTWSGFGEGIKYKQRPRSQELYARPLSFQLDFNVNTL